MPAGGFAGAAAVEVAAVEVAVVVGVVVLVV